ncbi:MAG TPA: hypothetical protein VN133_10860 [Humibacter sp.]|nr:hypothetical protein [Humibacter sp.]
MASLRMRYLTGALAFSTALWLSACTDGTPGSVRPSSAAEGSTSATSKATAGSSVPSAASSAAPTLIIGGSAAQNKVLFDRVNQRTVHAHRDPLGADFVRGLTSAGFAKKDMQVTADRTSVGLPPGSLQFSVRWHGQCLIGQYGKDIGGYHSEVVGLLQTGDCLIGHTVPIR